MNMAATCIGDKSGRKDGIEGTVIDLPKYGKEYHVAIKISNDEERELKLFDYFRN